jgi:ABC-type tungstate transport system substrate-binding protein
MIAAQLAVTMSEFGDAFSLAFVLVVLLNAGMGLSRVVVSLFVYLLPSRAGPLGTLGLRFSPGAMIIAQQQTPAARAFLAGELRW